MEECQMKQPGPGSDGTFEASSVIPTSKIVEIATKAYNDFAAEAINNLIRVDDRHGGKAVSRYKLNCCSSTFYKGYEPILSMKSPQGATKRVVWRDAA
jgi:hypothetical protein